MMKNRENLIRRIGNVQSVTAKLDKSVTVINCMFDDSDRNKSQNSSGYL